MTEVNAGEMPTELEAVLPVPDVAEIETAPETAPPDAAVEANAAAPSEAGEQRGLPFDVEHLGVLRRSVLDHLLDTAEQGPQSVAQILSAMPLGTTRNSTESAIRREWEQGRIERTSPGHYVLAPPRPPEPKHAAPPDPEPARSDAMTNPDWWSDALEAWLLDPSTWDVDELGPPLDRPDHRIPRDIATRFADRLRKREERRRDRGAAAARQAEADRVLRDQLLAACNGNYSRDLPTADLAPVRLMRRSSRSIALSRRSASRSIDGAFLATRP
jgi:hypothetical protein